MPFLSPFNAIQSLFANARSLFSITESQSTDATSGTSALGQFTLDGSAWASSTTLQLQSVMSVSDGALTGTLILYNLTDAEVVATQTTSSTSPVSQSTPLTIGAAVGDIKTSAKTYEIRLSVSGSTAVDIVSLGSAVLVTN